MSEGQIIPPGQHAPFAVVSEDDHGAWILVGAALGTSFTLVTVVTRVLIRLFVNRGWGWDDSLCILATVLSWIQAGLVLAAAGAGLGKSAALIRPLSALGTAQQSYYASNIFYILALDISKISLVYFLRRLVTKGSLLQKYTLALIGVISVSMFAFVIATSIQCDASAPWDIVGASCPNWFLKWQVHGIVECVFEVAICAAPLWLVYGLQTGLQNKVEVVLPFALRLIVIVFTGLRLRSFNTAGLSTDFTLREAPYICWTQAEITYSIIAATIPTARRLMLDFITYYNGGNFGYTGTRTGGTSGLSGGRSGGGHTGDGIQMRSFRSGTGPKQKSVLGFGSGGAGDGEGDGPGVLSDADSQEMIIRKDVSIRVDNDLGRQESFSNKPTFLRP